MNTLGLIIRRTIGVGLLVLFGVFCVVAIIIGTVLMPVMMILGYFVKRHYSQKVGNKHDKSALDNRSGKES